MRILLLVLLQSVAVWAKILPPPFDSQRAYQLIEAQLKFGPRVPQSTAHKKTGDWVIAELKKLGLSVEEQKGSSTGPDGKPVAIRNIIARQFPKESRRFMISAHWDSRPYADQEADLKKKTLPVPGANDAASGVAVMLEMAKGMAKKPPQKVGVDYFFWDVEDLGLPHVKDSFCLGSQYWAKSSHWPGYKPLVNINLDMVGAKGAKFPYEVFSYVQAKAWTTKIWDQAEKLGHGAFFPKVEGGFITDDHQYVGRIRGIPAVDIIHYDSQSGFFPEWHTVRDTIQIIDVKTLKAVGETVLGVIYQEAGQ